MRLDREQLLAWAGSRKFADDRTYVGKEITIDDIKTAILALVEPPEDREATCGFCYGKGGFPV